MRDDLYSPINSNDDLIPIYEAIPEAQPENVGSWWPEGCTIHDSNGRQFVIVVGGYDNAAKVKPVR